MEDKFFRNINVVSVYDGDTITADVDLGYGVWLHKQKFRLLDINAPEVRTRDAKMKLKGYFVRDYLRKRIEEAETVTIQSVSKGKYGRWLCNLYINGKNIVPELLKLPGVTKYL